VVKAMTVGGNWETDEGIRRTMGRGAGGGWEAVGGVTTGEDPPGSRRRGSRHVASERRHRWPAWYPVHPRLGSSLPRRNGRASASTHSAKAVARTPQGLARPTVG